MWPCGVSYDPKRTLEVATVAFDERGQIEKEDSRDFAETS